MTAGRMGRRMSPGRRMRVVGAAIAVLLASPPPGAAQGIAAGRVQGQVFDTTGQALPGVRVELETEGAALLSAQTAASGRYEIDGVPAGTYNVRFSLLSFVTLLRRDVTVGPGAVATADATLYVAATASVVVSGRSTFRNLSTVSDQDELVGVADAASTGVITALELNERARRRPAEALESVPGMVVSQHSGEGKANQYYLRGFNIDHGTDLALSVAGMPVNLPTHGHGQGYADMNFLIPELVSGIQYPQGHLRGRVRRLLRRRLDPRELREPARRTSGARRGRSLRLRPGVRCSLAAGGRRSSAGGRRGDGQRRPVAAA